MTQIVPTALRKVRLDDKFNPGPAHVYLTGIDALTRLPILQHEIDTAAGLNTGGFISGYRGSPLGGLDQALWRAKTHLDLHNIEFVPGINEELAATAVWGTQQLGIVSHTDFDGVFGMWYGKGPGVDRSMDAIKHANAFGTSPHGGVLAIAGDDHACKSSTLPHQSEHMFIGASVPVLAPSNVQEVLDFGIYGWAMSRFTGCWVALKAITDNMDAAMGVEVDGSRYNIALPPKEAMSPDGMHARWPDTPLAQERRLNKYKIYAARLFASINGLNRIVFDSKEPRIGIITSGKAYLDVMEALRGLGINESSANNLGIRVLKIGMPWPLDPEIIQAFAEGLSEIVVVEEKRSIIEDQLTSLLYNLAIRSRPTIFGEFDHRGEHLLGNTGELDPDVVAEAISSRLTANGIHSPKAAQVSTSVRLNADTRATARAPHFCSGCPHNTSTKVPEGSVAMGGIGCHYMATWMPDRDTRTFSQMGGEGAAWIGQARFSKRPHVFQNLGDGTYFHSGSLAIRAAVASGANITFKILFNEAVAMTGGQAIDGNLSLNRLLDQVRAEGVDHIAVVTEDLSKSSLPRFVEVCRRSGFDALQQRYANLSGTSVIIYQQLCASEKRRRQKRRLLPASTKKVYIHPELCEGCGDCGRQSTCLSIQPLPTELGVKRTIDQHSCNTDYSCIDGFCPSFITVSGTANPQSLMNKTPSDTLFDPLPNPRLAPLREPWNCLIAGIGGTGVLTASSILAMAAHIEGKGFATMNQTGLAQKYGEVISHLKIATTQSDICAVRIKQNQADLMIGCDAVVAASTEALNKLNDVCHAVVNSHCTETRDFIYSPEKQVTQRGSESLILRQVDTKRFTTIDAVDYATQLVGDPIGANLFMVGIASQSGLLPITPEAIERAIEVNGVAVDLNAQAFLWGRRFVAQPDRVSSLLTRTVESQLNSLDDIVDDRASRLVEYQSVRYAKRYKRQIESFQSILLRIEGAETLCCEVARQLYRIMALKDEYEVARLLTRSVATTLPNGISERDMSFYLAPTMLTKLIGSTEKPQKIRFGAWMRFPLRVLSSLKVLRGSAWDIFGYSEERKAEWRDLDLYLDDLNLIMNLTTKQNLSEAHELASAVTLLRGYGHIRTKQRQLWLDNREKYRSLLTLVHPLQN